MFFLLYLVLGGMVWFLGLVLGRRQMVSYSVLSLLLVLVGLVLFTLLSAWAGIVPLSLGDGALVSYSVSFPDGYLGRGATGIAILCIGILGMLSPAALAWMMSRESPSPRPAH